MKARLFGHIAELRGDRAGASSAAAVFAAVRSRRAQHVAHAGLEIECAGPKCLDRAGRQAGSIRAAIAGMGARLSRRKGDPLGQPQPTAVGVPETEGLVDQKADGARMHGLTAQGETLKRQRRCRRPAGIEVQRSELAGELSDRAPRPSIERMRLSVLRLARAREGAPLGAACEAEQYQGSAFRAGKVRAQLAGLRVECAANSETARHRAPTELIEEHGKA